jgi:hypothetical protein
MKKHLRRTLIAAIGVLAGLVVPAVAQAHHIKTTASCAAGQNGPVVTYKVEFIQFSSGAKPQTKGTVKVQGDTVKAVPNPDKINWSKEPGTLSGTTDGTPGVQNTVVADFSWGSGSSKQTVKTNVCPTPPPPKHPAIALDKTGADTAAAGSTFTYSFKATNTGDVTLTNVVLTDDKCQSTLTRTEPNLADATFDPGDEWFYTCTVIAPAGPAQVDNIAEVCGDYQPPQGDKKTVCADNPHTFTVPPPDTPPAPPTPPTTPTTPESTPTPPGGSGVLPETIVSGRAALRGPSGCVKQAFRARVRGRSIASVTFFVDGRHVKRISGKHSVYSLTVRPGRYGFGRHRIVARVVFTAESGTKARRLPLTFRRCSQGAVAPRFTG